MVCNFFSLNGHRSWLLEVRNHKDSDICCTLGPQSVCCTVDTVQNVPYKFNFDIVSSGCIWCVWLLLCWIEPITPVSMPESDDRQFDRQPRIMSSPHTYILLSWLLQQGLKVAIQTSQLPDGLQNYACMCVTWLRVALAAPWSKMLWQCRGM